MTALVEEALSVNSLSTYFRFPKSGASMFSYTLMPASSLAGEKINTLVLPETASLSAILRNNRPMIPSWTDDVFEVNDEIILLVSATGEMIWKILNELLRMLQAELKILDANENNNDSDFDL